MSKKSDKSKASENKHEFDPQWTPRLLGWMARDGLTDQQMADELGVSRVTIHNWKKKHPDVVSALKRNKDFVDHMVEDSLLKRAMGYTDPDGKHIPADTTACIFWLKNRKPQEWRDKQQVDMNVAGGVLVVPEPEDDDE